MKHSISYYNRLSIAVIAIFLILVSLQITWVRNAIAFTQKEINYELKLLAPEIALNINTLDHDAFHIDKSEMDRVPEERIQDIINQQLADKGIDGSIVYAIYQDSSAHIYRSNGEAFLEELINSDAKACLSCIVSFSTISKEDAHLLEDATPSSRELMKSSTLQYYSPVSGGRDAEPELWLALHQPQSILPVIKSMMYLFGINILLLLLLLSLFYILLRSLSKHKQMTQVKEDFFNNVTHEFKTPLSSIRLASKVLLNNPIEEKRVNYINLIEKESKSLEGQIDRLLELSLVDNDKITFEKENIPVCALLYEIPSKLKPLIEDKASTINIDCELTDHIIEGDYYHLLNAFGSLVENSLKYGAHGVNIWIKASLDKDRLVIEFKDNGPGIPIEHQQHIFERFYRGQKSDQYKGSGFGIGLSYVHSTLEAHNAKIELVQSSPLGTSFIIKF